MFSLCFFRSSRPFFTFQDPLVCFLELSSALVPALSITLPTQAFLSSAADVNRANEQAFTLLEALDVPTVYNLR